MTDHRPIPGKSLLRGKTCLIVDDDSVFCEIAASVLCREMAKPVVRHSGADALDYLENFHCDLAMIDLVMPNVDGFRLISLIRHMTKFRHMPIAVATSRLDERARDDAARLGVGCFMTKPINWLTFASHLEPMLSAWEIATATGDDGSV